MAEGVLGVELYTVRAFTQTIEGVAESLKKIADIGYATLELAHSHDALGPVDPKEVRSLVENNGLTVVSMHWPWDRFVNDLDAVIEEHLLYDCKRPVIAGTVRAEYDTAEGFKLFMSELEPVVYKLAQNDMILTYHNPFQQFARVGDRYWFDMLYEQTDASMLNFELDTFWLQYAGVDSVLWVKKLARRQSMLHLKDMTLSRQKNLRCAPVGEGNLNWPAILEAAQESGIEYYFVEQDLFYGLDPFEALAISYRNLKAMGLG